MCKEKDLDVIVHQSTTCEQLQSLLKTSKEKQQERREFIKGLLICLCLTLFFVGLSIILTEYVATTKQEVNSWLKLISGTEVVVFSIYGFYLVLKMPTDIRSSQK